MNGPGFFKTGEKLGELRPYDVKKLFTIQAEKICVSETVMFASRPVCETPLPAKLEVMKAWLPALASRSDTPPRTKKLFLSERLKSRRPPNALELTVLGAELDTVPVGEETPFKSEKRAFAV